MSPQSIANPEHVALPEPKGLADVQKSIFSAQVQHDIRAEKIFNVARHITVRLQSSEKLKSSEVAKLMSDEFGGKSSSGAWTRKDSYEAQEIAEVMLLHTFARYFKTLQPAQVLNILRVKQAQLPTQTVRSKTQQKFQQFSTPLPLAMLAVRAARVGRADIMLEPSAGTGIIAAMAKLNNAQVVVNEWEPQRVAFLRRMFNSELVFRKNAERIDDELPTTITPSVIIANPPFSRSPGKEKNDPEVILRHLNSSLDRLAEFGRLVLISGENFKPSSPTWREAFVDIQERATVIGSFGVSGRAYATHGTSFDTRITVFDKLPARNPNVFSNVRDTKLRSLELFPLIERLPPRFQTYGARLLVALPTRKAKPKTQVKKERKKPAKQARAKPQTKRPPATPPAAAPPSEKKKRTLTPATAQPIVIGQTGQLPQEEKAQIPQLKPRVGDRKAEPLPPDTSSVELSPVAPEPEPEVIEPVSVEVLPPEEPPTRELEPERDTTPTVVQYVVDEMPLNDSGGLQDPSDIFEAYYPKRVKFIGAIAHPTQLVESAAMSVVVPPIPTYEALLPKFVIYDGVLSNSQLETVTYAGEANSSYLMGKHKYDPEGDRLVPTPKDDPEGSYYRRGFFLGDGTGAGKGRQCAGIIMDNWLHGRRRAVWVSKSRPLLEDAIRDWKALGGKEDDIHNLNKWKLGTDITLGDGIIFCTYSTLRTERGDRARLDQLQKWLGEDFNGAIIFDEAHEMGNAIAGKRGVGASKQGLVGVRLQNMNPEARVSYISATGATDVRNLSYAQRLGFWGTGEYPFDSCNDFITKIEKGGVAAMEIVARDSKAQGLYLSRVLSFKGVVNDPLRVTLTPEQVAMYDKYANAFRLVQQQMNDALKISGITDVGGSSLNGQAKGKAIGMFESAKQRFFNHIITAMKVPEMIKAIEEDLANDRAAVIQIVSTNEALIDRKVLEIPEAERDDLNIDITPRDIIIDYLMKSFPIHVYEQREKNGHTYSELVRDENGDPLISRRAQNIRDNLIKEVLTLPPLPGAIEQLLYHFGEENVAEVTGRSKRILYDRETDRHYISKIPSGSKTAETAAFMNGEKNILIFSQAGGTGRSYHSDINCNNQRQRVHYLLEAGWNASSAVQGLGRSHRTNQRHPPIFRVVMTNVLGELRFASTICRRINTLGALTRGQRQAAGQDIFDESSNLESHYAVKALHYLYDRILNSKIDGFSEQEFFEATGLKLRSSDGEELENKPPMPRFLNRLLGLPIDEQNQLFGELDQLHRGVIEAAIEAGTYESGLQELVGRSFTLKDRTLLYTHPKTGATTTCSEIMVEKDVHILEVDAALKIAQEKGQASQSLYVNAQSGRAAIVIEAPSIVNSQGEIIDRIRLVKPTSEIKFNERTFKETKWDVVGEEEWRQAWEKEARDSPKTTTDRVFIVSGLLLPVWTSMGTADSRVFRAKLDNGEDILGRIVLPKEMERITKSMGLAAKVALTPNEIYSAVLNEGEKIRIGAGVSLKRSRVNHEQRIEITSSTLGLSGPMLSRLEAAGAFSEMISYQYRAFVPVDETKGPLAIASIQEAFGAAG